MGELPLSRAPAPAARVLGVVLAAGFGRRMGGPKADLVIDGERLLDRALRTLVGGGCDDVLAVVQPGTVLSPGVPGRTVENPDASSGMRSSLLLATFAADGFDGLAVTLVDTPGVDSPSVQAVLAIWRAHPDRISVAVNNGRRGHPIAMSVSRWRDSIAAAAPDEGARTYLQDHADDVDEVAVDADTTDLDTPEDVERWGTRPRC